MPRYKAILAYDGTLFRGWQRQPSEPSIQETLEAVLTRLQKTKGEVVGSGRTDAGVHAHGQVMHFDSPLELEGSRWTKAFNSQLPKSIKLLSVEETDEDFHARFSATRRLYHYYFKSDEFVMPWQSPYCWSLGRPIHDLEKLREMAKTLIGTHDFSSFTSSRDPSPSKIRSIFGAEFIPWEEGFCFRLEGSSFLWNQVRSTLGTLLEFDRKGKSLDEFQALLETPNRKGAGTTAPPHGLFLEKVFYASEDRSRLIL